MRIVITGVRGFVGSVLAQRAAELGHKVIGLDDESRGLNRVVDGVNYVRHDCLGGISEGIYTAMKGYVMRPTVDAVVHFAALTGELSRPQEVMNLYNVEMAKRVYLDALQFGAKAFVFPVSSLALGVPDSPYVISKEKALRELKDLDLEHKIGVMLRFFNVTGAYKGLSEVRKNEVHIIPRMVECYEAQHRGEDKPFVINGGDYATKDGTPSRDLTNVVDVADYILSLIVLKTGGHTVQTHPDDGAVWLGTGVCTTVRQALEVFEQYAGPIETVMGPRRALDCGALNVDHGQSERFRWNRGGLLVPARISIRDEIETLLGMQH